MRHYLTFALLPKPDIPSEILKFERMPLIKIRERREGGQGGPSHVPRDTYQNAAKAAVRKAAQRPVWRMRRVERQARMRDLYLAQELRAANAALGTGEVRCRARANFVASLNTYSRTRRLRYGAVSRNVWRTIGACQFL